MSCRYLVVAVFVIVHPKQIPIRRYLVLPSFFCFFFGHNPGCFLFRFSHVYLLSRRCGPCFPFFFSFLVISFTEIRTGSLENGGAGTKKKPKISNETKRGRDRAMASGRKRKWCAAPKGTEKERGAHPHLLICIRSFACAHLHALPTCCGRLRGSLDAKDGLCGMSVPALPRVAPLGVATPRDYPLDYPGSISPRK